MLSLLKDFARVWISKRRELPGTDGRCTKKSFSFNWDDLNAIGAESSDAITLMGPPKEHSGERSNRYAYMLLEAIILLNKSGYSVDICPFERIQKHTAWDPNKKQSMVSGILESLMTDVLPSTKIVVKKKDGQAVAWLSFMSYKQPWLNLLCLTRESKILNAVLSKRFVLVELAHGVTSIPVDTSGLYLIDASGFEVKIRTGTTRSCELFTSFELEKESNIICRALWSYENTHFDFVGPSMEKFEIMGPWQGFELHSLFLSFMEQQMTKTFNPLVAFHVRISSNNDADAMKWFHLRGYSVLDSRRQEGLCKAFAVF